MAFARSVQSIEYTGGVGYATRTASCCRGLLLLFTNAPSATCADAPPNLVPNGNFKQVRDGKPDRWGAYGNAQKVAQTLVVGTEGDTSFAKLTCTRCEGSGGDSHAMIAQVGGVNVEKGKATNSPAAHARIT